MQLLINELNLDKYIKFHDPVPYDRIKDYLYRADIGVVTYLPYLNNMSCLSNKLFEYMASGLPVVASNFPLYREVIKGGRFGILVDPTSPEKIAEAIGKLILRII
jgi:glycosyltransferase involved in cell wall biosynthesis